MCCTQAVSKQATNRLSFAYKLRSPDDAVLSQYNSLSTNNKQVENKYAFSDLCHFGTARHQTMSRQMKQDCLACRYTKGITVSALMRQFYQDRVSINHVGAVCAVDCTIKSGDERMHLQVAFGPCQTQTAIARLSTACRTW